jgi:hypothetical protein
MLDITLATDQANLESIHSWHLRLSCAFYDVRRSDGESRQVARFEATRYLRRKTGWSEATAAGALDAALEIRDKQELLEATIPLDSEDLRL